MKIYFIRTVCRNTVQSKNDERNDSKQYHSRKEMTGMFTDYAFLNLFLIMSYLSWTVKSIECMTGFHILKMVS